MEYPKTIRLKTERLLLRPFRKEDSAAVFRNWHSDPAVFTYLDQECAKEEKQSLQYCMQRIPYYDLPYFFDWVIVLREKEESIGELNAVYRKKNNSVSIGFCLGSRFWNQGLMQEALKTVMEYFRDSGIAVVEAECHRDNIACRHVLENCGLVLVGFLPETKLYRFRKTF